MNRIIRFCTAHWIGLWVAMSVVATVATTVATIYFDLRWEIVLGCIISLILSIVTAMGEWGAISERVWRGVERISEVAFLASVGYYGITIMLLVDGAVSIMLSVCIMWPAKIDGAEIVCGVGITAFVFGLVSIPFEMETRRQLRRRRR